MSWMRLEKNISPFCVWFWMMREIREGRAAQARPGWLGLAPGFVKLELLARFGSRFYGFEAFTLACQETLIDWATSPFEPLVTSQYAFCHKREKKTFLPPPLSFWLGSAWGFLILELCSWVLANYVCKSKWQLHEVFNISCMPVTLSKLFG